MFGALFEYGSFAAAVVAFFLFVRPCRFGVRAQALWAAVLLLCASKFHVFAALGLDPFIPELPPIVIALWGWANAGLFVLVAFACAGWFLRPRVKAWLLPLLAWGIAAWGVWGGVQEPVLRRVEVVVPDLPPALEGYTIAHLADPHASSLLRAARTRRLVSLIDAARPDLVVCTGDIVDGRVNRRAADVLPLMDLQAPDGVWFVAGNHEFYGDAQAWKAWYARQGFRFLREEWVRVRPDLIVAGVDDEAAGRTGTATTNAAAVLARIPKTGAFTIFLQHRPGEARENAARGVDLQLSGHTHGGILPGFDRLVKNANNGFVRGLYDLGGGKKLYVSSGAGQWAGVPVRWFVPPEIAFLTLTRGKPRAPHADKAGQISPR